MHLDRMEASASYFNFYFDRAAIASRLLALSALFESEALYRVRLLLDEWGEFSIQHSKHVADAPDTIVRALLSAERTSSRDLFLRHKTTHRELYQSEFARCRAAGFDEVIFLNERDEVTEGAISNIFIRTQGELRTPPLRSGVLPGIFRRFLLETDRSAKEEILTMQDLESAEAIYLCNSLRGMREIELVEADAIAGAGSLK
jgi:para-aminobenzoate synthetase/4-amino-4-deoxychorismate lyase